MFHNPMRAKEVALVVPGVSRIRLCFRGCIRMRLSVPGGASSRLVACGVVGLATSHRGIKVCVTLGGMFSCSSAMSWEGAVQVVRCGCIWSSAPGGGNSHEGSLVVPGQFDVACVSVMSEPSTGNFPLVVRAVSVVSVSIPLVLKTFEIWVVWGAGLSSFMSGAVCVSDAPQLNFMN
jgi:hypothetical protein